MTHWSRTIPGNPRNGSGSSDPQLWVTAEYEYAIVVQRDWRPFVWQRERPSGEWTGVDISGTSIGIVNDQDSHNALAIAVDGAGFVHVAGNMHNEQMRYARSTAPHDITAWTNMAMPTSWTSYVTNLVANPAVTDTTDGWATLAGWTLARVLNGANGYAETVRSTGDATQRRGVVRYGGLAGHTLPVTPGQTYTGYVSMRSFQGGTQRVVRIEWRSGQTVLSTSSGALAAQPDTSRLWPSWCTAVAPAGADHTVVVVAECLASGTNQPAAGDRCYFDTMMFVLGAKDSPDYSDPSSTPGGTASAPAGWVWNGAPHASTSRGSAKMQGVSGADVSTYQRFERFSDGTIVWLHDQNDSHAAVGRDMVLLRLAAGGPGWVPCSGNGELMTTAGGLSNGSDTVPDRCYASLFHVDRFDVLHGVFVWRRHTSCSASMDAPFYARSYDKGTTWVDLAGGALPTPFQPTMLNGIAFSTSADCEVIAVERPVATSDPRHPFIVVDGMHVGLATAANLVVDDLGRPHIAAGNVHIWWDGVSWQSESLGAWGYSPTISFVRGDLWVWGRKATWLKGTNLTRGAAEAVTVGACQPGAEPSNFKSGASYAPAPVHAGGLDGGRGVTAILLPDGDRPRVFRLGDGVLGRV